MNTHRIIVGDCIHGMKTLPDGCINTCITSPPYFGLRDYGSDGSEIGREKTVEEYVQRMVSVFGEVKRILRKDGTLWLNLGDSYMASPCVPVPQTLGGRRGLPTTFVPGNRMKQNGLKYKDLIGIPWRVAFALQADGWYLRQDIIWHKNYHMPESVVDRCTRSHEYIFLLSKRPRYHFDHDAMKEPVVSGDPELRNKRSVWTVPPKSFAGAHFATFPEELITPCVLAGCPKDGMVFDPFTGSGTTAVVALKHGRNFVGTELNAEYAEMAQNRIANSVPSTLEGLI